VDAIVYFMPTEPIEDEKRPHPLPEPHPPHLMKILMELSEKIGKLEGMMEVLLKQHEH